MYFDIEPKQSIEDLYNYRREYTKLKRTIARGEKLVVVKGIRRVGKTSVMRVVYNELKNPKLFIDAREWSDASSLMRYAVAKLMFELDLYSKVFTYLSSVSLGPLTLNIKDSKATVKSLDRILKKRNTKAVIFIDEAQNLKDLDKVLSFYYDNTKQLQFVISGSEVGVLDMLFSTHSHLFGRLREEIMLKPLPKSSALEFLRLGFEQAGIRVPSYELEDAVQNLDGLMGWLTYYGYLRKDHTHDEALKKLRKDAKSIVKAELLNFLNKRKGEKNRYLVVLKALSSGIEHWDDLLLFLESKEKKRISKSRLKHYLDALINHGFVVKYNSSYKLADAMLKLLF